MSQPFTTRILAAALTLTAGLYAQNALATNVVVGPNTCQPGKPHYATIQAAVNAAPNAGIVLVCPGTYLEQVSITKPLTLKGVTDGTNNAAIVKVPATGLVINGFAPTYFLGPVTGQVVVQNTSGVTVSNLIIDGTGSGCVSGAIREVGIFAYNVGNTVVSNVTVRNEITGCQTGEGILSDTSTITVNGNQVHDIDRTGILIQGGVGTVENNNVQSAAFYGISMYLASKTLVTLNTVAGLTSSFQGSSFSAILVQNSSNSVVSKNTLLASPNQFGETIGIWAYGNPNANSLLANIVSAFGYGIALQGCSNTVVQTNKLSELLQDGIYEVTSLGGNNITKNTVNEAAFGIFTDSSVSGDTLVPNTFYNTTTTIDPNPSSIGTPSDQ